MEMEISITEVESSRNLVRSSCLGRGLTGRVKFRVTVLSSTILHQYFICFYLFYLFILLL